MKLINGSVEEFKSYSQFKSVGEFNYHLRKWLEDPETKLSKKEVQAIRKLSCFAVKIIGVSNAGIDTVLKAAQKEISRATFKRMIVKAKAAGILTIYRLIRENGAYSSNLYVFNRFPKEESTAQDKPTIEPCPNEVLSQHNLSSFKTKNKNNKEYKERNNVTRSKMTLPSSYTNDKVPKTFVKLVSCFYDCSDTIVEFWEMARKAAWEYHYENDRDLLEKQASLAFKEMIAKLKQQKVKKPIAYYYGILKNKLDSVYQLELSELETKYTVPPADHWLNMP